MDRVELADLVALLADVVTVADLRVADGATAATFLLTLDDFLYPVQPSLAGGPAIRMADLVASGADAAGDLGVADVAMSSGRARTYFSMTHTHDQPPYSFCP